MKAKATRRAMTMATRVTNYDSGNGDGNKGGRQVTATRAMAVATTEVGKDEGNGNDDKGGMQQRG